MTEYTAVEVNTLIQEETQSSLETMLREGARRMLQAALEMEVATYIEPRIQLVSAISVFVERNPVSLHKISWGV